MRDVSVHGLGTVGLPLAAALARRLRVLGVEVSPERRAAVRDGSAALGEPGLREAVADGLSSGRLRVSEGPEPAPVHLLCLPTPLAEGRADPTALEAAVDALAPHLRPGDLVCVESTVPPRTVPELAARLGRDDLLWAATPERLLPGAALHELRTVDRVVGGLTPEATERAATFVEEALGVAVHRTDARTACAAKLAENAARDVQVALANELADLAEAAGADPEAALALAGTHPRVDLLRPGIGVGGHCLPVDPWFLVEAAPERARLLPAARATNRAATDRALDRIRAAAGPEDRIALYGLAYKPGTGDLRNSPALAIARALVAEGRRVVAVDPLAPATPDLERAAADEALDADLAVFLVAHEAFRELAPRGAVLDLCGVLP